MIEKASFKSMIESLKDSEENERMHGHAYSTFNNLVYKKVLGRTAQQIKNERGLKDYSSVKDYITPYQLKQIEHLERFVDSLLRMGYEYPAIKDMVLVVNFTNKMLMK